MKIARFFPIFSVAFILAYAVTVYFNLAMFTYRPAMHQFYMFVPPAVKGIPGIPMFWYGWIVTAFLAALVITVVSAFVPALKEKGPWPALVWASPVFAVVVVVYVLRMWFTM
jgi:hypothetical protein